MLMIRKDAGRRLYSRPAIRRSFHLMNDCCSSSTERSPVTATSPLTERLPSGPFLMSSWVASCPDLSVIAVRWAISGWNIARSSLSRSTCAVMSPPLGASCAVALRGALPLMEVFAGTSNGDDGVVLYPLTWISSGLSTTASAGETRRSSAATLNRSTEMSGMETVQFEGEAEPPGGAGAAALAGAEPLADAVLAPEPGGAPASERADEPTASAAPAFAPPCPFNTNNFRGRGGRARAGAAPPGGRAGPAAAARRAA